MDSRLENKLIIGFDLCDDYSQISYFSHEDAEPKSVSTLYGEEKFQIPTVLFKTSEIDKWYIGDEALKAQNVKEGILVNDLIRKCSEDKKIYYEGAEYSAESLLEIFLRKALALLNYEGVTVKVPDAIMFSLKDVDKKVVTILKECSKNIGIERNNVYFTTHEESFVDYTMAQKEDIYRNDVLMLEYENNNMSYYVMRVNERTQPITIKIEEQIFSDICAYDRFKPDLEKDNKDSLLDEIVLHRLENELIDEKVSCVFLIGTGFEKDWAKQTLRFLCRNRRVFQGKNLYSKGACYGALRRLTLESGLKYLFLGKQKLMLNVGMELVCEGTNKYYSLVSAGENWYESKGICEVILEDTDTLEFKLIPIDNKDVRTVIVNLYDMPRRATKTVRMLIEIDFISEALGKIKVTDIGFGEFFKATNKTWEHDIEL